MEPHCWQFDLWEAEVSCVGKHRQHVVWLKPRSSKSRLAPNLVFLGLHVGAENLESYQKRPGGWEVPWVRVPGIARIR